MHRVLVLGGYGNFGSRICRALIGNSGIAVIVGGRNGRAGESFAQSIGAAAALTVDCAAPDFAAKLREHAIDTVIHTAGPFQAQGYEVALAAASAGSNYVDLADGRRFVCDYPIATRAAFLKAGRVGVSGASTLPALSSAVIDHLCAGWTRVDSIDLCIAPAQTAPRGTATLEAVLSYCGENVDVWRSGQWQSAIGWADPQPVHVNGLAPRIGAICDVPDLELFPKHYRVADRVEFRAALEVQITQRAFALIAWLRHRRLMPNPAVLASSLQRWGTLLDSLGTRRGGMYVRVSGVDAAGQRRTRSWHICADDDHGPEIPCMAAILLARALSRGEGPPPGSYACVGLLPLAAFEPEFARWDMTTEVVEDQ
jgi:hypothetical protein